MFERPHHQRIAQVLRALDGSLLRENNCLFGGGTAIALRYGEYRESVDIDFLVSDVGSYRTLRQLLTGLNGIAAILRDDAEPLTQAREVRADQYGIRTMLRVADQPIKFEIVLEGRIELSAPASSDEVCGIATLTPQDMAASKLLANSDRWGDDGVFNRDLIDLAMMEPSLALLRHAVEKAEGAYGGAILHDLDKALDRLQNRHGWLERCMQAMAMNLPKALVWQRLRALRRAHP
ncbi:MAG: nucleotidyl transferase AbiEii/AbiGii toxin family protein [Thiobacillus sp.]|nr:nucleotidyl transferase AbiEii/AbiGii toxin family protein [Thiobacillus sp.]